ncbi:MAG: DUF2330 domain-containing protein [Labilithrix sp.]|nr:DUF2330 domain-containing protein [Labilithrix sp.]
MKRRASSRVTFLLAAAVASATPALTRDAAACGGVFVPPTDLPSERQVVRDRRIAIAIGRTQTVLWDEVRFQGNPRELAWVSPVPPGTKIELASAEWMDALETSTQPIVYGPRDRGIGGCALTGCAESDDYDPRMSPGVGVVVVDESVIGPYETATIRSAGHPDAPYAWLTRNGYAVTPELAPLLHDYAEMGFDFAALRLRPTCATPRMEPVRMVMPGAVPKVLIRMALAGARTTADITLFVLAEAPHFPLGYPRAPIDEDALVWSFANDRSNYDALARAAMDREGGRTWLVEAATPVQPATSPNAAPLPSLAEAYEQLCVGGVPSGTERTPTTASPCVDDPAPSDGGGRAPDADAGDTDGGDADGGDAETDAGDSDAGDTDGGAGDGGAGDADDGGIGDGETPGTPTAPGEPTRPPGLRCRPAGPNDLELARETVGAPSVVVTRMRARLPPEALTADLDLGPDASARISNLHQALRDESEPDERPSKSSCASSHRRDLAAKWAPGVASLFVLAAWLRRRTRR